MNFNPHDYQDYAIRYIEKHPVAAVLLDMGLGKTIISLTAVEIQKWEHLRGLTYAVAVGTPKERKTALMQQADITIINRENIQWLIDESGFPFDFDMVIIDELSSFKNHKSKRFKSLMKVRPRIHRIIGLTGTPSSNGLMDLWAEFKVLDMGERLGRFITQYRSNYFMPDKLLHAGQAKRRDHLFLQAAALCGRCHLSEDFGYHDFHEIYRPSEDAGAGFNGIRSTAF